jgi:ornithine cyclodeaminase
MLVLSAADVEALLPMAAAIEAVRGAMVQVSEGKAVLPLRHFLDVPGSDGGKLVVMPGAMLSPHVFGVKTVAKYNHPPGSPFGSHVGTVQLFDAASGLLLAIIEGSSLTSIRTAAASALATDVLARPEARVLAVLGTGEQARRHVAAMRAVRAIDEVRIWGRTAEFAAALAAEVGGRACASVAEAVAGADIICTTTAAKAPILFGKDVAEGAHVNLVGAPVRTSAEADGALVARAEFFVDYRAAAAAAAGELLDAVEAGLVGAEHVRGEIGEVILGRVKGRSGDRAVTVYKSLGVTAQDLAAGMAVLAAAQAAGRGMRLALV